HGGIAREQKRDPARSEAPHDVQRRCEIEPTDGRDCGVKEIPRQNMAGPSKQPFQNSEWTKRPRKHRRIRDARVRLPVIPLVAHSICCVVDHPHLSPAGAARPGPGLSVQPCDRLDHVRRKGSDFLFYFYYRTNIPSCKEDESGGVMAPYVNCP